MASRNLTASFTLRTGVTGEGALGALQRRMEALHRLSERFNRIGDLARRFAGVGIIASALTFAGPVQSAAALDQQIRDIALTTGRTGAQVGEMIRDLQGDFERLALNTGQSTRDIASGVGQMLAAGLDEKDARGLAEVIARTSTAANAAVSDIAALGISAQQNLNIRPEGMYAALASLAQAGKEGSFELRAMSQYLPELTGQLKSLGMTGRGAFDSIGAALQVVKREAGSDGQAATNMRGFLNSLSAPDVAKKFKELNVDLPALLTAARRQGVDPIEAVIAKIQKLIEKAGGDSSKVLGQLFGNDESRNAARALVGNRADFVRIRRSARGAGTGVLDEDLGSQMDGPQRQVNQVTEMASQTQNRIGKGFLDGFLPALPLLRQVHEGLQGLDAEYAGVLNTTLAVVGGTMLLAGGLGTLALILPTLATGVRILLAPFTLATGAIGAMFGVGAIAATGILALAAVMIAAGIYIWKHWEQFRGFFRQIVTGLQDVLGGFDQWLSGWFTGNQASRVAAVQRMWRGLGTFFSGVWGTVKGLFSAFVGWVDGWSGGAATRTGQAFKRLWDGISDSFGQFKTWALNWISTEAKALVEQFKGPWGELTGWFGKLFEGIGAAFGRIWAPIQAAIDAAKKAMPTTEAEARANAQASTTSRTVDAEGNPTAGPTRTGRLNANPGSLIARQSVQLNGRITVGAEPGTRIREAETDTPGFTLAPAEPIGLMRGRP